MSSTRNLVQSEIARGFLVRYEVTGLDLLFLTLAGAFGDFSFVFIVAFTPGSKEEMEEEAERCLLLKVLSFASAPKFESSRLFQVFT